MQNDMLSGNPITINEETIAMQTLMSQTNRQTGQDAVKQSIENGYINVDSMIAYLVSAAAV